MGRKKQYINNDTMPYIHGELRMVNYYKQFESFLKDMKLEKNTEYLLDEFEYKMKLFYGLSKSTTIERWLNNFYNTKLINIKKKEIDNKQNKIIWVVIIN